MHARLVAVAVMAGSLLVVTDAALLDVVASRGTPSTTRCAARWNGSATVADRRLAGQRFEVAVVSGWLAKDRFPGCGVLFRHGNGQPWLWFSGQLHAGLVDDWAIASGDHWGFDSPEGGVDTPNAIVTTDGHVRLIET